MFAPTRTTFLALARSRPQLSSFAFRVPSAASVRPLLLRAPLSHLQHGQRHFSASARPWVQYTRFSNTYAHHNRRPNQDLAAKLLVFATAFGAVYFVAHLEQVPETGRWRFMDISPKYEAVLEKASYTSLLSDFQGKILPPNHPIALHVHRVVSGLLEASDLGTLHSINPHKLPTDDDPWSGDPFTSAPPRDSPPSSNGPAREWRLLVVNDPKIVNALASFGNIVVFTGILPVCKDEQGLAVVVGHEIGHAVARHASERYSYSKVLVILAMVLQAVGVDLGVTRLFNYLLFKLPNSRKQELEADTLGMRIAARACYDPQSAVEVHTRLARVSESRGLGSIEFLRTHPVPEHRIKHLEELLPEAYEIRDTSSRCAGIRESIQQFFGGVSRWA